MDLQRKRSLKIIYEIVMGILSLLVIIMLVIDLSNNLSKRVSYIFNIVYNLILVIFTIDYFTRFYFAKDKKKFFKNNIIDLIAIIPFNSVFQVARFLKLSKLLKFTKLFKFLKVFSSIALLLKFRKHIDKFIRTNNFHYVIWITLLTLLIGTMGIHFMEGLTIGNALWWSFVTITTVGYGDISPVTTIGRVIAGILMLVGIGFLSMLTGTIATFFLNKNNNTSYKNQIIEDIKSKLDNFDKLNIEDIDSIHNVLKALKQ